MTKTKTTLLPILFAVSIATMLSSAPVFAQVDPDSVGSAGVTGSSMFESISIEQIDPSATQITVDFTLVDGFLDGSINDILAFRIGITDQDVDTPLVIDDFRMVDVVPVGNTISRTVAISALDTSDGSLLDVEVIPFVNGANASSDFGTISDQVTVFEKLCGYDTVPDIDYGSLTKGQSATRPFTPSITDTGRFIQPTDVAFTIGSFQLADGTNVVGPEHTTINGVAGPTVPAITGVNADTSFEFITTLNFIDANAYVSSVGSTITQTTTITPQCVPAP